MRSFLGIVLALSVLVPISASAESSSVIFDRHYDASNAPLIHVSGTGSNIGAGVRVIGSDRPDVEVSARTGGPNANKVRIDVQQAGDRLDITLSDTVRRGFFQFYYNSPWVELTVLVPRMAAVDAAVTNGGVSVDSVSGAIRAQSANGGIAVKNAGSNLDLRTTNGSVNAAVSRMSGPTHINLETTNGSVRLRLPASFHGRVAATTTNGVVHNPYSAAPGPQTVTARSVNGSVVISN